ncbi:MAG: tetratricopeptide repeat protein [Myxococcales bacterium]|nr:tetratricopeptide repeat protein [Myxococcales bacterium]
MNSACPPASSCHAASLLARQAGFWQPMKQRLRWVSFWVALLLALGAGSAHAADLADQHYKRAIKAYEAKEYPLAIREFQAAYRARQLPRILLLIGQVYRKLGMASTALKFYQHYLRVEPNPKPDIKAEVDRYIAMTQAMLDPPEFEAPPSIAPVPEPHGKGAKRRKPTAAEEAAAAVAAAPSNVTSVTVPELYLEEGATGSAAAGGSGTPVRVGGGAGQTPASTPPAGSPGGPGTPGLQTPDALRSAARTGPATAPGVDLTTPGLQKEVPHKPFYKQAWFWGVVGGVAAVGIITGVAVGAGQANALPKEILKPTK